MSSDRHGEDNEYTWDGIYRAKCIDTRDNNKQGRVKVWIPDLMAAVPDVQGIWARPGNNPLGGRNSIETGDAHHYQGSCMIPPIGSWLYIFFECGDPSEPRYMCAGDYGQGMVLPECQEGDWWNKWVPIKTRRGRCIVLSDDPFDERVEITGKKIQIGNPPDGDIPSTTLIDGNQTTILLDERNNKQKVLIRTIKGDFLHIDVDEQMLQAYFKNDIRIKTDGNLHFQVAKDVFMAIDGNVYETIGKNKNLTVKENYNESVKANKNTTVKANYNISSVTTTVKGSSKVFITAPATEISGAVKSGPIQAVVTPGGPGAGGNTALPAISLPPTDPQGDRST